MRIAVMGTACMGKSTFVADFLKKWPMYRTNNQKYSNIKDIKLNEQGTEESQMKVLNFIVDQIISEPKDSNIILDRCVLDNLVYTTWLGMNGKVSDTFVKKTMDIVRETLVLYDVIFFFPITKYSPVSLVNKEHRSVDPKYREEIDVLFKSIMQKYNEHSKIMFPFDHELGCPAIIEMFGNPEERIQLASMYIKPDGSAFSDKDSLLNVQQDTDKPTLLDFH